MLLTVYVICSVFAMSQLRTAMRGQHKAWPPLCISNVFTRMCLPDHVCQKPYIGAPKWRHLRDHGDQSEAFAGEILAINRRQLQIE